MRILSLFDGISCARVALERSGIKVDAYYASEIDKNAMDVSKRNWPDTIQVGDVRKLKGKKITGGGTIDLLIGGSPCQDLSRANIKRTGLEGSRSSLFYEYLRLLKEVRPRYFVLENVASMPREARDEITKKLGVRPIMIDAALVSAQSRRRLFWTNIPGVCQPWDRGILLKHILEDGEKKKDGWMGAPVTKPVRIGKLKGTVGAQCSRVYSTGGKSITVSGSAGGGRTGYYWPIGDGTIAVKEATKRGYAIAEEGDSVDLSYPNSKTRRGRVGKKAKNLMTQSTLGVFTRGEVRPLTPVECERLQSLPDGYTEGRSGPKRVEVLGNAFNAEVVRHILAHI